MKNGRLVNLGEGLASIPIELLSDQAQGKVLFIVGAGVSKNSGLPSFRELVVETYKLRDSTVHEALRNLAEKFVFKPDAFRDFRPDQQAEIQAFCNGEYDVALGLLERRQFFESREKTGVLSAVAQILGRGALPSNVHESIIRLSDRGTGLAVVTTNFDLLLEAAAKKVGKTQQTYSLGEIMRPSLRPEFSGILHIHGALDLQGKRTRELVLTDEDFGQYYLRGRSIPDFIYDAARLYSIVLVGYSANDPPMKYLLSAVAADYGRFDDIKPRYAFIGKDRIDPVEQANWKGRGIIPIHYPAIDSDHSALEQTLSQWALFAPRKGRDAYFEREMLRITRKRPRDVSDSEMDRFELILHLSSETLRNHLLGRIGASGAHLEWLDIALNGDADKTREANNVS